MTWQDRAACLGADPEDFFPDVNMGKPDAATRAAWGRAKLVCARCPVRAECLTAHWDERHGVWGGTDPVQRGWFAAGRRRRKGYERVPVNTSGPAVAGPVAERKNGRNPGTNPSMTRPSRSGYRRLSDPRDTIGGEGMNTMTDQGTTTAVGTCASRTVAGGPANAAAAPRCDTPAVVVLLVACPRLHGIRQVDLCLTCAMRTLHTDLLCAPCALSDAVDVPLTAIAFTDPEEAGQ